MRSEEEPRPVSRPVYAHPPEKVVRGQLRHLGLGFLENLFFVIVAALSVAFGVVLLDHADNVWTVVVSLIVVWAVTAYLALPRLHRMLTGIYVPDYFIGRSRTSDGLLGDPVNLAVMGTEAQIHESMLRAGWVKADPITLGTSWRIVMSSLTRRSYPEAPVSPLLLFGRIQSFAYQQEVEGNPAQRHHVRFWQCPEDWLLPGGHRVDWLAAGTYDRAVGLSLFTLQVTHKIDRDIDVERDYVIDTVRYAVPQAGLTVIEDFSTGYHSRNGGGDAVATDGDLPVLLVDEVPVTELGGDVVTQRAAHEVLGDVGKRPTSVVAAWVLTLVGAVLQVGSIVRGWQQLDRDPVVSAAPDSVRWVAPALYLGLVVVLYGLILLLGWRTYQGHRLARLTTIAAVTTAQIGQVAQFLGGTGPTGGAIVSMSIDLLTVYALTSHSAREWTETRRDREARAVSSSGPRP